MSNALTNVSDLNLIVFSPQNACNARNVYFKWRVQTVIVNEKLNLIIWNYMELSLHHGRLISKCTY